MPAAFVRVTIRTPVSTLRTMTVALLTGRPAESATVPESIAPTTCAPTAVATMRTTQASVAARARVEHPVIGAVARTRYLPLFKAVNNAYLGIGCNPRGSLRTPLRRCRRYVRPIEPGHHRLYRRQHAI